MSTTPPPGADVSGVVVPDLAGEVAAELSSTARSCRSGATRSVG
ncbi:hypothetical protein [Paraoerskovia sediminicola]|nr:hypothetical protein [Paraoerskovia sediminicola]